MTSGELLYLSRSDVLATGLTMREVIDGLKEMFRQKSLGKVGRRRRQFTKDPIRLSIHASNAAYGIISNSENAPSSTWQPHGAV